MAEISRKKHCKGVSTKIRIVTLTVALPRIDCYNCKGVSTKIRIVTDLVIYITEAVMILQRSFH